MTDQDASTRMRVRGASLELMGLAGLVENKLKGVPDKVATKIMPIIDAYLTSAHDTRAKAGSNSKAAQVSRLRDGVGATKMARASRRKRCQRRSRKRGARESAQKGLKAWSVRTDL